ncbi:dihydrolipoyl dehydrogenase [Rubrivirga sp. SAORIC476]|uniref:dihydrolipoyl dehydrogenase n=1 Tax=Rubrivirga sp. SAORIC476 TaxID=1961794 RepID=UPI000BA9B29B|nr:dihydrolipoyl dehydrogenase [Rubrivirga sp. SAORIC476]MBC12578.1 dihydrolipoyl dehydrogenase [Rhodothermaceae bacterium]PAP79897.1 dihydrolipoyl dehydrogenase [Rubrivirga sp. SAORIC476]
MANAPYDILVIGSGPGGYEAAIRAHQLGLKTAIVEKNKLGGVCLNIGCIPTKALLKSAEIASQLAHISDYGFSGDGASIQADFPAIVKRSRGVADKMNKGVQFLMKKNKVDVFMGKATLLGGGKVSVEPSETMDGETVGEATEIEAKAIIIATGARARAIPTLPVDDKKIVDYKQAMLQTEQPESLVVVGAGAIGVEFAYVYHNLGTEVTIVELQDRLVPVEDEDVSKELARAYKKMGVKVMTGAQVTNVDTSGEGCVVTVETKKGTETLQAAQVLSAVGVVGNVEGFGLDEVGVEYDRGAIKVDSMYRTNVDGLYAIGDVIGGPWLAHVASHEGIVCVENIAHEMGKLDHAPHAVDYLNVPGCTYCLPQIASVGYTEAKAKEAGFDVLVGKFPFAASGKAAAIGDQTGFVKVVVDAKYGEVLGAHIIGHDATEMIAEVVTARALETTAHEVMEAMHPHPTLSEAVMEAFRDAYGQAINA